MKSCPCHVFLVDPSTSFISPASLFPRTKFPRQSACQSRVAKSSICSNVARGMGSACGLKSSAERRRRTTAPSGESGAVGEVGEAEVGREEEVKDSKPPNEVSSDSFVLTRDRKSTRLNSSHLG